MDLCWFLSSHFVQCVYHILRSFDGAFVGERSEDKEDLLQEQGMQEAHPAQGDSIQEG